MKLSLFALVSLMSLSAFSTTLKTQAELDFRQANGVDAGYYRVMTEITAANQASTADLKTTVEREDNDYYNVTTATFPIGTLKLTLQNVITGETLNKEYQLTATTSQQGAFTADAFVGEQTVYVTTTTTVDLPAVPPKGYSKVQVWLHPFNTLRLKAKLVKTAKGLTLIPQNLFTLGNIFANDSGNSLVLGYYLTAVEGSSISSLAVGNTPMTFVK